MSSSLDLTYGATFIGLIIASIFYGVTLIQTLIYYRSYSKDSLFMKCLVFGLWFLDTSHLVLCTIATYWGLITNYGNPGALVKPTWSQITQTDVNALIALIVQCFFARRVYRFSGNLWLTAIIVTFSIIHFALGIVFTVGVINIVYSSRLGQLIWVASVGLGSAAAADILIAGALCYYLLRSRTGVNRTDSLITTLILYSITTGLVTSIMAFLCVVLFATMPSNNIFLAFFWISGKCYVNSFLSALNSRESFRDSLKNNSSFLHLPRLSVVFAPGNSSSGHIEMVSKTECDCKPSPAGSRVDADPER